jgi:hypothetical protein
MSKYQTKKRQSLKVRQSKFNKIKNSLKGKKTHNKSIKQYGGVNPRIITIHNNGTGGEQNMGQQCIWISIRDYLRYHRGQPNHTIRTLKASVNLDPSTDRMEFDNDNPLLQNALEQLCKQLCIRIVIIFIDHNGTINDFSFNNDSNQVVQTLVYNQYGNCIQGAIPRAEDVYIASFGSHFELITEIPGVNYVLQPAPVAPRPAPAAAAAALNKSNPFFAPVAPASSQPKVLIHNVYVNINELQTKSDKEIATLRIKLVEKTQDIDYFKSHLEQITMNIKKQLPAIPALEANKDLNNSTKKSLKQMYLTDLNKLKTEYIRISGLIPDSNNEKKILKYKIELAEIQENIEHFKREIDIIQTKIEVLSADITDIKSNITSMQTNKISNTDTKDQMTAIYLSEIQNLETEIEEANSEKALHSERLKEFEEYKTKIEKKIISKQTKR